MTTWDPQQYAQFWDQRRRPALDLIARLRPDPAPRRILDLGCGPGTVTTLLADRWPDAEIVGVDSSPEMLDDARALLPDVTWVEADITTYEPDAAPDLVFTNAALHWVPDHSRVLAQWVAALAPGGQLVVQVPANPEHASHQASVAVAHTEPFLSAMGGEPPADPVDVNVLRPEQYAELLFELGLAEQHVRLQVYPHVLPSSAHVVEWTKGTSLTRFFARLPGELHEPFVDAYRTELLRRLGDREPYFYAFKRILMWGAAPSSA